MSSAETKSIEVVFCAVDFSETGSLALEHATSLARRHGAGLVLAHVVEPLPVAAAPILMVPPDADVELRKLAAERLEAMGSEVRSADLSVQTVLEDGTPGPRLIEMAEAAHADLIVLGTRGLTGIEHLVLGSTAEHVVRHAMLPVLTIHPDDGPPPETISTVIVPSDLEPDVTEAAEVFVRVFSGSSPPRVLLVFADPTPPYLDPFRHEALARWGQPDSRRDEIEERLAPTRKRLEIDGFEVEIDVLDGGPVQAVTRHAREHGVEMIVMTTRRHSTLANWLGGRTAQRIVQLAPCPVLTVRARAEDEGAA
jgi:nucleotide-binding universal stress UspA family protein